LPWPSVARAKLGVMELEQAIRRRRMVRAYDETRHVSRETIDGLLELAIHAPSAGFSQGWHFLVLDAPADRDRFWAACDEGDPADSWLRGMRTAPALILALSDKDAYLDRYAEADKGWTDRDEAHWPIPYWDVDTGMASMLLLLGLVDAGLAGCFFGVPGDRWDDVLAAFEIPGRLRPVGVISLGYPAPDRKSPSLKRGRRGRADVTSYGRYGTPA
jgi:nitroreductase